MSQDYNATLFFKIGWLHEKLLNFVFGPVFIDHPVLYSGSQPLHPTFENKIENKSGSDLF